MDEKLQNLVYHFNKEYALAISLSSSERYFNAALLGRQIVCEMEKLKIVKDNLEEYLNKEINDKYEII